MNEDEKALCCPKCGSTELSTDKKGFGTGKFVAGTLLINPLAGILFGGMGKDKREVCCLKCGGIFKPGGLTTVEQYKAQKKSAAQMKASGEESENTCMGCGIMLVIIGLLVSIVGISNNSTSPAIIISVVLVFIAVILFIVASQKKKQRLIKQEKDNLQAKQKAEQKAIEAKTQERNARIQEKIEKMKIKCLTCNTEVNGGMKFCPNCGNAIEIKGPFFCPNCEAEIASPDMKFCVQCGANLTSAPNDIYKDETASNIAPATVEDANTVKPEPVALPSKPGCLTYIGAFYLPLFFLFSKHKRIRIFSGIWLAIVLLIALIAGIGGSKKVESETPETRQQSSKVSSHLNKQNTNQVPDSSASTSNSVSAVKRKSTAEITLFHQLPASVQTALKSIGISEHFGTDVIRRKDLEDSAEMRAYKVTNCAKLPDMCNNSVIIYLKNSTLCDVSYCGRSIYGKNSPVHIKQAVVDWYCKYKRDNLHEIKDLITEGYMPSAYAVSSNGIDSRANTTPKSHVTNDPDYSNIRAVMTQRAVNRLGTTDVKSEQYSQSESSKETIKFKGSVEEQKLWERWKNIVQTLNGAGLTPAMLRAKLPKLPNVPKSSSPDAATSVEFEASPADKKLWDEWLPILYALEQVKITPAQMQAIIDSNTKK